MKDFSWYKLTADQIRISRSLVASCSYACRRRCWHGRVRLALEKCAVSKCAGSGWMARAATALGVCQANPQREQPIIMRGSVVAPRGRRRLCFQLNVHPHQTVFRHQSPNFRHNINTVGLHGFRHQFLLPTIEMPSLSTHVNPRWHLVNLVPIWTAQALTSFVAANLAFLCFMSCRPVNTP